MTKTLLSILAVAVVFCSRTSFGADEIQEVILRIDHGSRPAAAGFNNAFKNERAGAIRVLRAGLRYQTEGFYSGRCIPFCSGVLQPGESIIYISAWQPNAVGQYIDFFDIQYVDENGQTRTHSKKMVGIAIDKTGYAWLTYMDAAKHDFGQVKKRATSERTIVVKNIGGVSATEVGAALYDVNHGTSKTFRFKGGAYPGHGGTCSQTVAPQESCTVIVEFRPTKKRAYETFLDFHYKIYEGQQVHEHDSARLSGMGL